MLEADKLTIKLINVNFFRLFYLLPPTFARIPILKFFQKQPYGRVRMPETMYYEELLKELRSGCMMFSQESWDVDEEGRKLHDGDCNICPLDTVTC